MSPLEQAKERMDIPAIAGMLGIVLPKEKGLMRSPFREDRNPSFSIYDNGKKWKDFATGEGGDVVNFIERATGKNRSEASKLLIEMADTGKGYARLPPVIKRPCKATRKPETLPVIPPLARGTLKELSTLRTQRGLTGWAGLELAYERGMFGFCDYMGHRCWIVKDPSGRVAQARRLDGQPFENGVKAMTLKQSQASWPVGCTAIGDADIVEAVEGGTDFLCAFTLLAMLREHPEKVAICAMLGAGQTIHEDALPYFKGKHVVIYADNDEPGIEAGKRWRKQLKSIAREVVLKTPDKAGYDLSDEWREIWANQGEDDPPLSEIENAAPNEDAA